MGKKKASVQLFEAIRREYEFGAGTIKGVAAKFGVHRRLVREALTRQVPAPQKRSKRPRQRPRIDEVADLIDRLLEEDSKVPRKDRQTARRIRERICEERPDSRIAESTVRRYVRLRRLDLNLNASESFKAKFGGSPPPARGPSLVDDQRQDSFRAGAWPQQPIPLSLNGAPAVAGSEANAESLFIDPRSYTRSEDFPDASLLKIYDTTLRDGEQMPGVAISPDHKYLIARELSALGCHILDLGFPAVSGGERTALRLVLNGKRKGEIRDDLEVLVMCRANRHDIDATVAVIEETGFPAGAVTFLIFTSASNLHCKYKLGPMLLKREGVAPEELHAMPVGFFQQANRKIVSDAIQYARAKGVSKIEFGAEDASRTPLDQLIDLVGTAAEAGATRYIFADTTGSLTPESTRFYCQGLTRAFPQLERASHFHNDFDLGTANVITGIKNGFTTFSTTVNGLGERAGNARLHSVVAALRYLYGLEIPNFQYDRLWHMRKLVERITGIPVQAHEPVIGHNVFSHESGIHAHGVSICRRMYECIPYEEVGGEARVVYGKHSGTNTLMQLLKEHVREIEHDIDQEFVAAVLSEIKRLREIKCLGTEMSGSVDNYYKHLTTLGLNAEDVVKLAREIAASRSNRQIPADLSCHAEPSSS
jgi:2-isopropylmalate synthase